MDKLEIDVTVFSKLCYTLLEEIQDTGTVYDAIICPLRGGFYLSYFMSRHMNLPVCYIEVNSYKDDKSGDIAIGLQPELKGNSFLLCDDIYDSGTTNSVIHSLYPHVKIDTACLVTKDKNADVYSGMTVDKNIWVDFFWEVM